MILPTTNAPTIITSTAIVFTAIARAAISVATKVILLWLSCQYSITVWTSCTMETSGRISHSNRNVNILFYFKYPVLLLLPTVLIIIMKTNQSNDRTWTIIWCVVENLNFKFNMCWNICHVELFSGSLLSTFKISSSRNLPLPSSVATKKYQAAVWSCFYVWRDNEAQISATGTLLSANFASTCVGEREYITRQMFFFS